jgi:hypothetical protein
MVRNISDAQAAVGQTNPGGLGGLGGLNQYRNLGHAIAGSALDPATGLNNLYTSMLGRQGDPAGLNYWVSQLNSGAITPAQLSGLFQQSAEYKRTNGGGGDGTADGTYGGGGYGGDTTGSTQGSTSTSGAVGGTTGGQPSGTHGGTTDAGVTGSPNGPGTSNPYGDLSGISFGPTVSTTDYSNPSTSYSLPGTTSSPYGSLTSGLSYSIGINANAANPYGDLTGISFNGINGLADPTAAGIDGISGQTANGLGSIDNSQSDSYGSDSMDGTGDGGFGGDGGGEGGGGDGGGGEGGGGSGGGDDRNGGYIAKNKKQRTVPSPDKLPKDPQMVTRKVHTGEFVVRPEAVKAVPRGLLEYINSLGANPQKAGKAS